MSSAAAESGPVLALDLGDARIGVAVSDPDRRLAVPVGTIRTGAPDDLKAVAALVRERGATLVVVGHPLLLSGRRGDRAARAEAFAEALGSFVGVPVRLQDERLSTKEAERALREAGVSGLARRRAVDGSAAVVILESYLASSHGDERSDRG
jgi:putative holliday junction resolvase